MHSWTELGETFLLAAASQASMLDLLLQEHWFGFDAHVRIILLIQQKWPHLPLSKWLPLVTMSCQKPRGAVDRNEIGWWVSRETNEWLEPGNFASRKSTTATQRCYQPLLPRKKVAIWAAIHRRKTCWCVKAAHPALLCASPCQPLILLHIPIPGAETSGSAEAEGCSSSG